MKKSLAVLAVALAAGAAAGWMKGTFGASGEVKGPFVSLEPVSVLGLV